MSTVGPHAGEPPLGTDEDGVVWRRMHPVTPALKGWKVLVAAVAVVSYQAGDNLREAYDTFRDGWLVLVGAVAAVAVVGFVYSAIAWRMTRFAVTEESVHLRTGVLFRQQRRARLDRLQAVDVVQPLLARLLGLAELRLEVAGGAGSAVSLAFLRESDAQALRAELLALAAGLRRPSAAAVDPGAAPHATSDTAREAAPDVAMDALPGAPASVPGASAPLGPVGEAPEQQVYELPLGRLVAATVRSGATVWLVLVAAGAVTLAATARDVAAAFVLVPAFLGAAGFAWSRVNQGASFRAAISPDGIRLRHGLTESRAQTVPPGRVQAIRLRQGPFWRGPDWWRVEMNVAGYGQGSDQQQDSVLHPVATRQEALTALWLVLPDLGVDDPVSLIAAAMSGTGRDGGFTPAPRSARWVDPVGWRRRGVRVTGRALVTRSGRFFRVVDVVPHERTQSLGLAQGPVQRRLGLASFVVHSTPGPVGPRVEHLDAAVAAALLDEQAERARTARAHALPEQWMRPITPRGEPS